MYIFIFICLLILFTLFAYYNNSNNDIIKANIVMYI